MKEIEINCKDSFQYIRTNELRVNTVLQWKRNRTFTCGSKGLTSLMDWFFNLRAKNFSISFLMRNPCSTVWWREQEPFSREKRQLCWRRDALFGERKTIFYEKLHFTTSRLLLSNLQFFQAFYYSQQESKTRWNTLPLSCGWIAIIPDNSSMQLNFIFHELNRHCYQPFLYKRIYQAKHCTIALRLQNKSTVKVS